MIESDVVQRPRTSPPWRRPGLTRRVVLALGTTLLLIGPVVGLAYFAQGSIARDAETRGARDRAHTADLAARFVGHFIDDAATDLAFLTMERDVVEALRVDDRPTIARHLALATVAWPERSAMIAFDARGKEIVLAAGGRVAGVPAGGDLPLLTDDLWSRDQDPFRGALASEGPYVSVIRGPSGSVGDVRVAVSLAVRDQNTALGAVVAIIAPAALVQELDEALAGDDLARGRTVLIVDRTGSVVAGSDTAHPLASITSRLLEAELAGTHETTAAIDGEARILSAAPIEGTPWVLFISDPASTAFEKDLNRTVGWAALVMIAVAAASALLAVTMFALLARRHDQLAEGRLALQAANEDLALASRHKSEFLSRVSHELRTPMNAILGFTDLLDEQLRATTSERQQRYFRNVRQAGESLLELINEVLDLSRVESGRIELRPESATIQQIVEPVQATLRRSAAEKGIAFTATVAEGIVRVDGPRVRQVLYNLASNAVKYTERGGAVHFRATLEGDGLAVDVTDTGIGIASDRQARVFGMFERVNEDRSEASGTGLGLALSKLLVQTHGGTIDFVSREGVGSTFRVRLPGVAVRPEPSVEPMEVARAPAPG